MILFLAALDMFAVSQAIRADKEKTGSAAEELAREYHRLKQQTPDKKSDGSSESAPEQP